MSSSIFLYSGGILARPRGSVKVAQPTNMKPMTTPASCAEPAVGRLCAAVASRAASAWLKKPTAVGAWAETEPRGRQEQAGPSGEPNLAEWRRLISLSRTCGGGRGGRGSSRARLLQDQPPPLQLSPARAGERADCALCKGSPDGPTTPRAGCCLATRLGLLKIARRNGADEPGPTPNVQCHADRQLRQLHLQPRALFRRAGGRLSPCAATMRLGRTRFWPAGRTPSCSRPAPARRAKPASASI